MSTPEIIEEIIRLRSAGRKGALATVIEIRGSTPVRERLFTKNTDSWEGVSSRHFYRDKGYYHDRN